MTECSCRADKIVALAGNPNVGKSTIFNSLTGMKQHTGNWPGKTVASARGTCCSEQFSYTLVDLPGTYSLSARSPEEEIARDYLCQTPPDAVIVICDATCLERSLILALQIRELFSPVILCVNLMDEARKKQLHIDLALLSQLMKLPVVGTSAYNPASLQRLLQTLDQTVAHPEVCKSPVPDPCAAAETEDRQTARIATAESIFHQVVSGNSVKAFARDRLFDRILTSRSLGYPIMLFLLAVILWITIAGANYPSQLLSALLFQLQDKLTLIFHMLHAPAWLHGALVLGVYRVSAWVISVMLPPMAIFFPLFTLLEDAGYLPRIAYNLDRPFCCCKACGKQALTMAMGFGCNAVGVTGCRIIESPRERLLAVLTNSFVPCNGKFPTLIVLITLFFTGSVCGPASSLVSALFLTGLIALGILLTFLITKFLSVTLLKGLPTSFALELPPYRRPQFKSVLLRSVLDRTLFVLGRAVCVAAPAGLLIWLLANFSWNDSSLLQHMAALFDPFARLLGLDGAILLAFLLGFPANEIVLPITFMIYLAQGSMADPGSPSEILQILLQNGWTWKTAASTILFSMFHWPCSTTLLTIKKETGSLKWTLLAALLPTAAGICLCILFTLLTTVFL